MAMRRRGLAHKVKVLTVQGSEFITKYLEIVLLCTRNLD